MKLKSNLTCTIVSLLMVLFFTTVVHGAHPWAEDPPKGPDWGENPPGPGPDSEATLTKGSASVYNYSMLGIYQYVVMDVSMALVDYVYGTKAEGSIVGKKADNDSNRK